MAHHGAGEGLKYITPHPGRSGEKEIYSILIAHTRQEPWISESGSRTCRVAALWHRPPPRSTFNQATWQSQITNKAIKGVMTVTGSENAPPMTVSHPEPG